MEFYAVVGWLVYVFILSARVYRLFYNFIYETFYWQRRVVVVVAVRLPPLLGTHSAKRNENATALHASTPQVDGWQCMAQERGGPSGPGEPLEQRQQDALQFRLAFGQTGISCSSQQINTKLTMSLD